MTAPQRERSEETLGWMIEKLALEYPNRCGITEAETGRRTTYTEFHERTSRVANLLRELGVDQGDRIGLLMHTCTEYLEVVYGAAKIGVIVVLVNKRLSDPEMADHLRDSKVSGLLFSPKFAASASHLHEALSDMTMWWCSTEAASAPFDGVRDYDQLLAASSPDFVVSDADGLADCGWIIIYTSGTTGTPKGVVITQRNAMSADVTTILYLWNRFQPLLFPVVRGLVTSGLNHIAGLNHSTCPVIATGGEVILLDEFEPAKTLATIEKYRPNMAFAVGVMWEAILTQDLSKYDLSSVQVIGTAVSYHSRETFQKLHESFGAEVYYMFGMTETTTGTITTRRTSDVFERPGTLGKPHGFMDVRIMREDGTEASPGEPGELQYRGPTVFKEYFDRPDATKDAFIDGWFRSGDVVRADEDGYLYFVDRLKDMVKTGGLNVYAFEVERAIESHPRVLEAAVVGVPDDRWGEAVTAFVVAAPGADLSPDEVIEHAKQKIASYKVPKTVHVVNEIPKNAIGKKLKRVLVESVTNGSTN